MCNVLSDLCLHTEGAKEEKKILAMFLDALIKYLNQKNIRECIQLTIPGYGPLCQRSKQDLEETGPATSIVNNGKGQALFLFYKIQTLLPRE